MIQAFGDWLHRRQNVVSAIQWGMVALYLVLLIGPLAFPQIPELTHAVHILFWGVWWPGIILFTLMFGQFWCGLLCPDGAISQCASRHGLGRKAEGWMRQAWLPMTLFILLSITTDAMNGHEHPVGVLISVGGTSVAALIIGTFYGRDKRIWCRYLCPVASIFSLLARYSILHFKVSRTDWDAAPKPVSKPVDCPLLLDVRRLVSNEKCNMCGQCSGHREAVTLALRAPGEEIVTLTDAEVREWEAVGICFGLIGAAHAGLTAHGDLVEIIIRTALAGGLSALLLLVAALWSRKLAARLAYGLIPFGGISLALAALNHATGLTDGVLTAGLGIGVGWSLHLILRQTRFLPCHRRKWAIGITSLLLMGLLIYFLDN